MNAWGSAAAANKPEGSNEPPELAAAVPHFDTAKLLENQMQLMNDYQALWMATTQRLMNRGQAGQGADATSGEPVVKPEPGDNRFRDAAWSEDPIFFVTNALSPAKVQRVSIIDDGGKVMEVVVEDKQLSLAIGKKGQNVRLAAKLTGWRIDIESEEEKRREVEAQFGELEAGAEGDVTDAEGNALEATDEAIETAAPVAEDVAQPDAGTEPDAGDEPGESVE